MIGAHRLGPCLIAVLACCLLTSWPNPAAGQVTRRVSVSSTGEEGNGGSSSNSISMDGRYVAFQSVASNLVPGDTNGRSDVFVRDLLRQETVRVNVATDGTQANGKSEGPSITRDGRFVVFSSEAGNLVAGDSNGEVDVFVRDRWLGKTECASLSSLGEPANRESLSGTISEDGRFVAFMSQATNLVEPDTNGQMDVFVHDRDTGETIMASVSSTGVQGNLWSLRPSISADGHKVAFSSLSNNLTEWDTNLWDDIFVRDLQLGITERVSVRSDGIQADHYSGMCRISGDGRFVSFVSQATNLVEDDHNGVIDAFLHDRQTGETTRVTVNGQGEEANAGLFYTRPSLSDDGRRVAFVSPATNLVSGDTNDEYDAFVHDRTLGTTRRVSVDSLGSQAGAGVSFISSCALSADGRITAYSSDSPDLVEDDENGREDVFVHGPAFTLEVDPALPTLGSLLNLSTWRGTPTDPCALFVTALNGEARWALINLASLDPNGEWLQSLRVPHDPTLLGHSFQLAVVAAQPYSGRFVMTNEVSVSIN